MRLPQRLMHYAFPADMTCVMCGWNAEGSALCEACKAKLDKQLLTGELCPRCGHPLDADGSCAMCSRGWLLEGKSVWNHREMARQLVHSLKFTNFRRAADALAEGMVTAALELTDGMDAAITWVPMPPSRMRERSYDHAKELAHQLAERTGLPLVQALTRVERNGSIDHQLGLNAEKRFYNLRGTFAATDECYGVLLLIDDVLTTGATAALATECLLENGAARVLTLTATRALGDEGGIDDV